MINQKEGETELTLKVHYNDMVSCMRVIFFRDLKMCFI